MSRAVDELESLLDQYWNLAFQEGKTGVSQGDKANEVLHALRMNHHAARAEALSEVANYFFRRGCRSYLGYEVNAIVNGMADREGK